MRRALMAGLLLAAQPALAQSPAAEPGPPALAIDCADFDAVEIARKAQVDQQIAIIGAAASAGDSATFCQASLDLLAIYRSTANAAAACSAERAARWTEAARATRNALAGACP